MIVDTSAAELATLIRDGELTSTEVTTAFAERTAALEPKLNAFLHLDAEAAIRAAERVDEKIKRRQPTSPLAGVPIALKDLIATSDMPTTAGSRMLEGWVPPYNATVTERLRQADLPILGKTNCDEFAMGSSGEHSAFGPTRNPWDLTRVPGGTSSGSASATAAGCTPLAIGTDTGGSVRQPAAYCGVVGHRPTYGTVSRFGLVAFASSLDQAGPMAATVRDAALLFDIIAGWDPRDSTSVRRALPASAKAAEKGARADLRGMTVGVIQECSGEGYDPTIMKSFERTLHLVKEMGATVTYVSCPRFRFALEAYYIIAPSECSSNLARFDGIRYGNRVGAGTSVDDMIAATRGAGFGPEVKRRIMLGTYALSAGYYDAFYDKAQRVRTLIVRDYEEAFQSCGVLVSPTAPCGPFKIGERIDDPMRMYAADLATLPGSLAGVPGISVPSDLLGGLPVGFQVTAPHLADDRCFRVAAAVEAAVGGIGLAECRHRLLAP